MNKTILAALAAASVLANCMAQDIKLPSPGMARPSTGVVEALATRHSTRGYSDRKLTLRELGGLCRAACGVSRPARTIARHPQL